MDWRGGSVDKSICHQILDLSLIFWIYRWREPTHVYTYTYMEDTHILRKLKYLFPVCTFKVTLM